jgi:hypothetical protein
VLVEEAARVRAKEREEKKMEHAQDLFRLHPETKWWTYMNMWYVVFLFRSSVLLIVSMC